jgi:rubredoxin
VITRQELSARVELAPEAISPDLFLCPVCGSVGILGRQGFALTERPAWFRCGSCEYVFRREATRNFQKLGADHEVRA